jgi:hypothetical protein
MLCRLTMFGESHLFPLAVLHITQYAIPGLSTFRTVSESSLPSTSYFSNQNHFQVFFTPLSMALIWPGTTRFRSKISFLLDVILTDVWRCDCFVAHCETRTQQQYIHVRLVTNSHTHTYMYNTCILLQNSGTRRRHDLRLISRLYNNLV